MSKKSPASEPSPLSLRQAQRTKALRELALAAVAFGMICTTSGRAQTSSDGYVAVRDDVQLSYRVFGSAERTFIIVHGQAPGFVTDSYIDAFAPLADSYRLVFYDRRGNGRSTWLRDPELIRATKHIEDLEAIRQHLEADRLTVLGESFGAGLAALYAAAHPDRVDRVVLVAAIPVRRALPTMNEHSARSGR